MRRLMLGLAFALIAGTFVTAAGAQDAAKEAAGQEPAQVQQQSPVPADGPVRGGPGRQAMAACRGDMQTLCGAVERGGGRKIACLKENQAKLSPGCQAAIQAVLDKAGGGRAGTAGAAGTNAAGAGAAGAGALSHAAVRQACQSDQATLCAGVAKGEGRIAKCMKDNADKLSPGCQAAMGERKTKMQMLRKDVRAACASDSQTLCGPGVKGHTAMQCLREKEAQVSPGCRQVLASLPKR